MFRIRFHGRGGHGIKTAGHILGSALFDSGYEVQDAPIYGAERRGAPIFAYVRAAKTPIHERGVIRTPDLVVVADSTLIPVAAAGVLVGISDKTVVLIASRDKPEEWSQRLNLTGPVFTLPVHEAEDQAERPLVGAACAGAAARLIGVIPRPALEKALTLELAAFGPAVIEENKSRALSAFDAMAAHEGCVKEGAVEPQEAPRWVDLGLEEPPISAPAIFDGATSVEVRTGLWRMMRPVIDYDHCNRCAWICSTFCPDSAINVDAEGRPQVDYDHCKGCMICVAVCPRHAIAAVPEQGQAKAS